MLKISYAPCYHLELPEGHRFPMLKYSLLHDQLLYEGVVSEKNFFEPAYPDPSFCIPPHDKVYVEKLLNLDLTPLEIRKTGFPLSQELIYREFIITNGTVECSHHALKYGIAMNIAGGTHHSFPDRGDGFCLLNDQAVAATILLKEKRAEKILIIDLDVHQGDGTAKIFEHEDKVFTFSMHGATNYPARKERSDLDIPLPDKTEDFEYLKILNDTLPELIIKVKPDFVFYQSGVDVLKTDKLGKLSLTQEGCKERDRIVFTACKAGNLPVVTSMGGGYSENIRDILNAHCNTFKLAQEIFF